jgi:hypothetical protein
MTFLEPSCYSPLEVPFLLHSMCSVTLPLVILEAPGLFRDKDYKENDLRPGLLSSGTGGAPTEPPLSPVTQEAIRGGNSSQRGS